MLTMVGIVIVYFYATFIDLSTVLDLKLEQQYSYHLCMLDSVCIYNGI